VRRGKDWGGGREGGTGDVTDRDQGRTTHLVAHGGTQCSLSVRHWASVFTDQFVLVTEKCTAGWRNWAKVTQPQVLELRVCLLSTWLSCWAGLASLCDLRVSGTYEVESKYSRCSDMGERQRVNDALTKTRNVYVCAEHCGAWWGLWGGETSLRRDDGLKAQQDTVAEGRSLLS
jgi:hypothetical protein